MDDQQDLTLILKSRFPLVVIETHEEPRVLSMLERIANLEGWPLFTWSVADGIRRVMGKGDGILETYSPVEALRHIDKTAQNGLYTLLDFHPYLADPINARLVKEIALGYHKTARTLVFVSARIELPPDLQRLSARFHLTMPDAQAIRAIAQEEFDLWKSESGSSISGQQEALQLLLKHIAGLCHDDVRRLIRQAVRDDGAITFADVERVQKAKFDMAGGEGMLSLEPDTAQFFDVGGQHNLKLWLERRRPAFFGELRDAGLDAPKGILLLGVQGGGKSLAAKAVAGAWRLPLLRLDFAVLYNKFHGETERNLRDALRMAEAVAPCVLWLDEIEKGLSMDGGGSSDGGVSRRVLGTLLTWMAERKAPAFLVATSNDVSGLPPELMRKGRLDEIFFVDLPDESVRKDIFHIHLLKRRQDPAHFDLDVLARSSEGFSGAEIEQAVVSALYESHALSEPLNTRLVIQELERTHPLSVVRAEEVQALRDWARERTVPA